MHEGHALPDVNHCQDQQQAPRSSGAACSTRGARGRPCAGAAMMAVTCQGAHKGHHDLSQLSAQRQLAATRKISWCGPAAMMQLKQESTGKCLKNDGTAGPGGLRMAPHVPWQHTHLEGGQHEYGDAQRAVQGHIILPLIPTPVPARRVRPSCDCPHMSTPRKKPKAPRQ